MMENDYLLANINVDTAENGPWKGLKIGTLQMAPMEMKKRGHAC